MRVIKVLAVALVLAFCVLALNAEKSEAGQICWFLADNTTGGYTYVKLSTMDLGDFASNTSWYYSDNYALAGLAAQVFPNGVINSQVVNGSMIRTSAFTFEVALNMLGISSYTDIAAGPQLDVVDLHMVLNPFTFNGTYSRASTANMTGAATTQKSFSGTAALVTCF
ncbi:MAG: hypothetical protein HQK97_00390 [Nitrospirae bacterium]|nr:hypothetical protein [Nitrospirota bacterium]